MKTAKGDALAIAAFTKAATDGNPVAQAYLAYQFYTGHGTHQDEAAARDWYQRAAKQGFAEAQLRLGLLVLVGRGGPADPAVAAQWFSLAAKQGNGLAAAQVGFLHMVGLGFKANPATARQWFTQARQDGALVAGNIGFCALYRYFDPAHPVADASACAGAPQFYAVSPKGVMTIGGDMRGVSLGDFSHPGILLGDLGSCLSSDAILPRS